MNAIAPAETIAPLVTYNVTEAAIAAIAEKCAPLSADTSQGYEEVRLAIANIRETRVAIEKRRVELKADALAYGRLVDSEAKRFTDLLVAIEEPLKQKKADVDYEKSRVKAEKEAAERKVVEDRIRAEQAAEDARLKAERDAEEARLRTLREAEEAKLADERARLAEERRIADEAARVQREAFEAEQAATRKAQQAEQARLDAERAAVEKERRAVAAEREAAERAEFERVAKVKAEEEAKAKAERERVEAAELQARIEAVKPDLEKVRSFAASILALVPPKVRSKKVAASLSAATATLAQVASGLEGVAASPKAVA